MWLWENKKQWHVERYKAGKVLPVGRGNPKWSHGPSPPIITFPPNFQAIDLFHYVYAAHAVSQGRLSFCCQSLSLSTRIRSPLLHLVSEWLCHCRRGWTFFCSHSSGLAATRTQPPLWRCNCSESGWSTELPNHGGQPQVLFQKWPQAFSKLHKWLEKSLNSII